MTSKRDFEETVQLDRTYPQVLAAVYTFLILFAAPFCELLYFFVMAKR